MSTMRNPAWGRWTDPDADDGAAPPRPIHTAPRADREQTRGNWHGAPPGPDALSGCPDCRRLVRYDTDGRGGVVVLNFEDRRPHRCTLTPTPEPVE